jgi:tetratricopeptide (TPR) repeat protein
MRMSGWLAVVVAVVSAGGCGSAREKPADAPSAAAVPPAAVPERGPGIHLAPEHTGASARAGRSEPVASPPTVPATSPPAASPSAATDAAKSGECAGSGSDLARCVDSEQPLARFGALVAAGRHDEAFEHFVGKLGAGARDDPRVQASFAGWLIFNAGQDEARRRLQQLATAGVATMEVESYLGLLAGSRKQCPAALKHHARAEQALEPGTALFIDFPRVIRRDARAIALYLRAVTERRCKRGDPVATAGRALMFDPSLAAAHTLIGGRHLAKRKNDAAAAAYERAIAADPEHAEAHIALGSLRESQCRFADALPLLDRGWQLNPYETDGLAYLLCHAYARAGRKDDAIRACRTYVANNRDADNADEVALMVNLLIVVGDAMTEVIAKQDSERCP